MAVRSVATTPDIDRQTFHKMDRIYELAYMADGIVNLIGLADESNVQPPDESVAAACMAVHHMLYEIKEITGGSQSATPKAAEPEGDDFVSVPVATRLCK
ncbi:MAG: hypothetical protein QM769_02160 [Pseudoxanthomonas sp.]